MKNIILIILGSLLSVSADALDFNPLWTICKVDSDCAWETSACGCPIAINRNYHSQFSNYVQELKGLVDCEISADCIISDERRAALELTKKYTVCSTGTCKIDIPSFESIQQNTTCSKEIRLCFDEPYKRIAQEPQKLPGYTSCKKDEDCADLGKDFRCTHMKYNASKDPRTCALAGGYFCTIPVK